LSEGKLRIDIEKRKIIFWVGLPSLPTGFVFEPPAISTPEIYF
jgi:hypothetical protein